MNNIYNLIDEMESYFDTCKKVPITNKLMVDLEYIYEFMNDLRSKLPEEIKRAERIVNEKDKILEDAKHTAINVEKEAENRVAALINEHVIKKQAEAQSEQLLNEAHHTAAEIKMSAYHYVDELLAQVEAAMQDTADQTKQHYGRLEVYLEKQCDVIGQNRDELKHRKQNN